MQHAAQAYGKIAKTTASPRELEADLLLKAASRLQAVHDSWDANAAQLEDALLYNRKLWSVFLGSLSSGEHPLPREIRQNVANLGVFVMNHTISLIAEPRRDKIKSLININREIAAGLLGRA
jgi:flagellar protein FlaF